jgi:hypothetical protein
MSDMKASLNTLIPQQGLESGPGFDVGGCEPPPIFNPAPEPSPLPPDIFEPEIIVNPGPEGPVAGPEGEPPPDVVVNPFTQGPELGPIVNPAPENPVWAAIEGGIQLNEGDKPFKPIKP